VRKVGPPHPFQIEAFFAQGLSRYLLPNAAAVSLKALESPLALVYLGFSICGHAC